MTFYQELQLNQAGSKSLIQHACGTGQKIRHTAVYLFKIAVTLIFCVAFVSLYSAVFGSQNSIAGVVVLLCLMVFRFADFGIRPAGGLSVMALSFLVLAAGPRLSNALPPAAGFLVNAACIFLLMFFGCHHVVMGNHSTLVLGYLLLYGYDVSGHAYLLRLAGLGIGALLSALVYYRKHRRKPYKRTLKYLFSEFRLSSSRTRWQLALTLGVSSAVFFMEWLGFPRAMWAGIAAMSVMVPFGSDLKERVRGRIPGNLLGGILFTALFFFLPAKLFPYLGLLGGIGVGLSATYRWQAVFNSLGAMSAAVGLIGFPAAVFFRIFHNIFGALYGQVFYRLWNLLTDRYAARKSLCAS